MNFSDSISVVIPCYKSSDALNQLCGRLVNYFNNYGLAYELILINDGSPDGTWSRILGIQDSYNFVKAINLSKNFGQHNAVLCGVRNASYPTVVTIDDDLQTPPEEIGKLLAKYREGYHVVYGTRARERHGFFRNLASLVTKLVLTRVMGAHIAKNITAFRIFKTQLRDSFKEIKGQYVSIDVLLTWGTSSFAAVEVEHLERKSGESNYTLLRLITHTMNMLTGFSTLPLKFASFIGLFFTFFGIILLVYILGRYFFFSDSLQGFTFLASSIVIFSGAQLLAIGIMGEYISRIYSRSFGRPPYVVDEIVLQELVDYEGSE